MTWIRRNPAVVALGVVVLAATVVLILTQGGTRRPDAGSAAGTRTTALGSGDSAPSPDATAPGDRTGVGPTDPEVTGTRPEERPAGPTPVPLRSPDRAWEAGPEAVLAAGVAAARDRWTDLAVPAWPPTERPVYVVAGHLGADRVEGDVVIAWRTGQPTDQVVLRLLAASRALTDAGGDLTVAVEDAEGPLDARIDHAGARLLVPLDRLADAGQAVALRVRFAYDLVATSSLGGRQGPADFGLLASNPDGAVLGHWLPLLTLPGEDGPMVPWGDVGGFPVAVFRARLTHDGVLVTGATDRRCDGGAAATGTTGATTGPVGCTVATGVALRDLAAVRFDVPPALAAAPVGRLRVRAVAPRSVTDVAGARAALDETIDAVTSFVERFGPLAWTEFDVVAAPLGSGAAGMEFPGLAIIDAARFTELDGQFGTFVIAHEAAHQWFHALVGNGSLSSPVVDESLAQYLTYLAWVDQRGEAAGEAFATQALLGRYRQALAAGLVDEPPAQPLADLEPEAYGPLVYGRAAQAWVVAEDVVGRDRVVAFLADLVDRYGLDAVTDDQMLADAAAFDPRLGDTLARWWVDPTPVPD